MTDPSVHPGDVVSIGHPKGSVNWIVDPSDIDRLVPIGAVGELLIEGPTVSEGYLNDLEKTNIAFVQAPQWMSEYGSGREGSRFYRSGDLVRYDSRTGSMAFVARIDNQIKVHGQRFELAEIELALAACAASIQHYAVLSITEGLLQNKLTAVVSFRGPLSEYPLVGDPLRLSKADVRELGQELRRVREALASSLPAYALPTIWIVLQSLPLTTSGKTDRQRVMQWLVTIDQATLKQSQALSVGNLGEASQLIDEEQAIWDIVHPTLNIDPAMRIAAMARKNAFHISVRDLLVSRGLSELARRAAATVPVHLISHFS